MVPLLLSLTCVGSMESETARKERRAGRRVALSFDFAAMDPHGSTSATGVPGKKRAFKDVFKARTTIEQSAEGGEDGRGEKERARRRLFGRACFFSLSSLPPSQGFCSEKIS